MLKGHNIICFSNDWHQDPLSKHHIMSRLARQNRILWVNSIGMRRPRAAAQDAAKLWKKMTALMFQNVYRPLSNLYVANFFAIPFHGHSFIDALNGRLLAWQLKYRQFSLGFKNPILWTFLPNIVGILKYINRKSLIYYLTDDFTQFTGHPAQAVAEMEKRLIEQADIVITSARRLAETKAGGKTEIAVVPHGVDHKHFRKALEIDIDQVPGDVRDLRHPVIGFYGEINDWLDLRLLTEIARKRPGWSLVLIGRIAVEVGDIGYLTDLPNVHWLGQKNYEQLPAYCAAFDVALIPMKMNALTVNVNPLKLREYLAAGLPVVSSPLPEVEVYKDVVLLAETVEQWLRAIEQALRRPKEKWAHRLSRRVAGEDWEVKVEEISEIIEKALSDHP